MLKKLIKHEFIATARLFLPLFIATILITPVFGLLFRIDLNINTNPLIGILTTLGIVAYTFLLIGVMVISQIFIITRFYRTTATSEAYLTFTLPASPTQILASKLITASIWLLASYLLIFLSVCVVAMMNGSLTDILNGFLAAMTESDGLAHSQLISLLISVGTTFIVGIPSGILLYYCCIMLGQLFYEHRVISAFAMYIGLNTVVQVVSIVLFFLITPNWIWTSAADSTQAASNQVSIIYMYFTAGLNLVFGIIYFFISNLIMKKKLNVH